jgi:hypothetical protein
MLRRVVVVIGLGVVVIAWAAPTFAGRSFVEVSGRVVPLAAQSASGRSIVLPDGSTATSGQARIEIAITNRYPLPVTLDFDGSAFAAGLMIRDATAGTPVWEASADDPQLEQADESPDGGTSRRVVRIAPGTTLVTPDGLALDVAGTHVVAPGTYALHISAYGVGGSPLLLTVVDAAARG